MALRDDSRNEQSRAESCDEVPALGGALRCGWLEAEPRHERESRCVPLPDGLRPFGRFVGCDPTNRPANGRFFLWPYGRSV